MSNGLVKIKMRVLPADAKVLDAIQLLNEVYPKLIGIADPTNSELVFGTLSDGDIRRALLGGAELEHRVLKFSNHQFHYVENDSSPENAKALLFGGIKLVPIGKEMSIDGQLEAYAEVKAPAGHIAGLIMAGGRGLRLRPITEKIPKPMLLIDGKPMISHQIEALAQANIRKVYISVSYLKEQIMDFVGDGSRFNTEVTFLEEEEPLGTGGSLRLLPQDVDRIIVLNADVITKLTLENLLDDWARSASDLVTACKIYSHTIPFGVIELASGKVSGLVEKPNIKKHVNTGIYALGPRVIQIARGFKSRFDLPDLIEKCISENLIVTPFLIHEDWADVGTHEALTAINEE